MGRGEIARNEQFHLFSQCFLPNWRTLCHFHQVWNCRLQSLSVLTSLKFVVWERVKMVQIESLCNKLNMPQMKKFGSKSLINIVEKGENAPFPYLFFQKAFFSGLFNSLPHDPEF